MAILSRIKSFFTTAWSWVKKGISSLTGIPSKLKTALGSVKKWGALALSAVLAAVAAIEHVRRVKAEKGKEEAVSKLGGAEKKAGAAAAALEAQDNAVKRQQEIAKDSQAKAKRAGKDSSLYNDIAESWNKGGEE